MVAGFAAGLGVAWLVAVLDFCVLPRVVFEAAKADATASARIIVLIRKNLLIFILHLSIGDSGLCLQIISARTTYATAMFMPEQTGLSNHRKAENKAGFWLEIEGPVAGVDVALFPQRPNCHIYYSLLSLRFIPKRSAIR